jgi:preprotein translocase subunit SecE
MPAEKVGEENEGRRRRLTLRSKTQVEETPQPVVLERGMTAGKGRATPSRRRQEEEDEDEGNVITRTGGGLAEYFEGVRSELRKVAWPTREETGRLTVVVLGTLIVSAIVLGLISTIFTELFRIGLNAPAILFAVMIIAVAAGLIVYQRSNNQRSNY